MAKVIPGILAILLTTVLLRPESAWGAGVSIASTGIKSENADVVLQRMVKLRAQAPDDITALRALLDNELNTSPIYKAAWDEGTTIFQQRKTNLVDPGFETVPDEYHIALITYTLHDTPKPTAFYSDFNTKTRLLTDDTSIQNFPYKSFFKLLDLAIQTLSKDPKFQNVKPIYYRGASLRFSFSVGQEVAFQQYTSTTIDKTKAVEYAKGTTMFEFEGPIPKSIYVFHHSGFPDEQEVLVSPLVKYKVKKIDYGFGSPYTTHTMNVVQ